MVNVSNSDNQTAYVMSFLVSFPFSKLKISGLAGCSNMERSKGSQTSRGGPKRRSEADMGSKQSGNVEDRPSLKLKCRGRSSPPPSWPRLYMWPSTTRASFFFSSAPYRLNQFHTIRTEVCDDRGCPATGTGRAGRSSSTRPATADGMARSAPSSRTASATAGPRSSTGTLLMGLSPSS